MKRKGDSFGMKHKVKWASYEFFRRGGAGARKLLGIKEKTKVGMAKGRKLKEWAFIALMLIIPVINFCVFWVYVNSSQIALAFQKLDSNGNYYFTFDNFKRVFEIFREGDSVLLSSLRNTAIFWVFNNFLLFPLIIFCAYVMKRKMMGTRFFRVVFYLPAIVSSVALTAMFKYIFTVGPGADYFQLLGNLKAKPKFFTDPDYAMGMLLFYNLLTGLGGNLVLVSGAMSRVPDELVESAAIDGATMRTEFFKIYLPLCWPTFSTLLIMAAAGFFNSSSEILLLTQGQGETFTFSYYIFCLIGDDSRIVKEYELASAVGLVMTMIALPVVLIVRYFIGKVYADVEF